MKINREQILNGFLESIASVSDEEYQKRVWIEGRGPECDDFDEFVSYFFDESEAILNNYKDFKITDDQYKLLIKFHNVLEIFSGKNRRPEEFISSPQWKEIQAMAKEILKAFNYNKAVEKNTLIDLRIKNNVLSRIGNVLNTKSQHKTKVKRRTHSFGSLKENTEDLFFDDEQVEELLKNYEKYDVSEEQYKLLVKFFELYDKSSDENWDEVHKAGRAVLKAFNYPIS